MAKEPGNRIQAPGPLGLIQAFVNSVDREHAVDDLDCPAGLADWLVRNEIWTRPHKVTGAELGEVVELREALRELLLTNNVGGESTEAVAVLDRMARTVPLVLRFTADGQSRLASVDSGVPAAMAEILAAVHTAMLDGSWRSMKACKADVCKWIYFDRSHNQSSQWCSMALCGARAKMRAYRRRTAATG
jgi:predicted RNA-binding Zn ribbon-like protein